MARLVDKNRKLLDIQMAVWAGDGWGLDWSEDFYNVGDLEYDADPFVQAYKVDNVYDALEAAQDWSENVGDWSMDTTDKLDKAVDWLIWDL